MSPATETPYSRLTHLVILYNKIADFRKPFRLILQNGAASVADMARFLLSKYSSVSGEGAKHGQDGQDRSLADVRQF
jgi:hypothetical protein